MMDLSKLAEELANAVTSKIDEKNAKANEAEANSRLVSAILSKPILMVPQDIMLILGVGKTKAYDLLKDERFPRTFLIARQKYCWTEDLMQALPKFSEDA